MSKRYAIKKSTEGTANPEEEFFSYEEVRDILIKMLEGHLHDAKAMKITKPSTILSFVKAVVWSVQDIDNRIAELTGEQKNELVSDVVIWVIYDELDIDLPYVPDAVEKMFFKVILNKWLIPLAVDWVKNRF